METVLHVNSTGRCTHAYCTYGSFFFHRGPSTALLANSGENCTSAAAATKPAALPTIGQGSDVLLTMGPMPKLMNSEPHSGANSNDQTHFLRTGPAEEASFMSVTHYCFCLHPMADLCQIRVISMLNAIHMKAKQRCNCFQQQMQEMSAEVRWYACQACFYSCMQSQPL